ncbi:hypothetical protein E2542_SST08210 [Spatholobus suberectus]|nr:hypothetical protein E2542_SST08210 [Spatholobus suberectus]
MHKVHESREAPREASNYSGWDSYVNRATGSFGDFNQQLQRKFEFQKGRDVNALHSMLERCNVVTFDWTSVALCWSNESNAQLERQDALHKYISPE